MAGIERIYVNNYKNYKEFCEWAKNQIITFFDGFKVQLTDYIYEHSEEDFDGRELSLMRTPTYVDVYLLKHCPFKFVIDQLYKVYSKESIEELKQIDLSKPPQEPFYRKNRKIIIIPYKGSCKLKNKPQKYNYKVEFNGRIISEKIKRWCLTSISNMMYNSITNTWIDSSLNNYPTYSFSKDYKTIKSLVRHLRKQYLPQGHLFDLYGKYLNETYKIIAI